MTYERSPIPCKNPQHPDHVDRHTMVCVKDTPIESVWACKACLDIHKVYSVQVRSKPKYKQQVRAQLAKEGKLLTAPPPVRRRQTMDESLYKKLRG